MQFIYVFDEADRDILIKAGYQLLKESENNNGHIYVFATDNRLEFNQRGLSKYVLSNFLAF